MNDAGKILFSQATICDELPPIDDGGVVTTDTVEMHEDCWRQVEFVHSASVSNVQRAIEEFLVFREAHRRGLGFTDVYVRRNTHPSLEGLGMRAADIAPTLRPLAIDGKRVVGGFAVTDSSGAYLYGHALPDGAVRHMGLEPPSGTPLSPGFAERVAGLAQKYDLLIADWYKGLLVEEVTEGTLAQWAALYRTPREADRPDG